MAKGSPCAREEQQAVLWPQIANSEPGRRAAALIRQMRDAVGQGMDHVMNNDGAQQILRITRDICAPDGDNAIYQEVDRFALF